MASNEGSDAGPNSLLDNIELLEAVAFIPPKQRHTDVSQLAKSIASGAYESGIPRFALERLVKLITVSNNLDQGTTTTLIKNLYPLERVPSKLVTQIVCCLGTASNKPSPATQSLLLRWLILVYDFLDDRAHLLKLYAVLFNCLAISSLRKPLCHVLSLITRRKHVKPFRIQALMELLQNTGAQEKELISLLRVFKNYCPDIIVGDSGSRGAGLFFKHPDPEWSSHLKLLQDANAERIQAAHPASFQVVHRGAAKRGKMEVIVPDVKTSRVSRNHTSLEELRSISHFVDRIEKIELPNQIVSTLGDNLAQKYIHLVHPETANGRLDDWLNGFLDDKLEHIQEGDDSDSEELTYLLSLAVEYVRYTKEIPSAISSFLRRYLPLWDGTNNRDQTLHLLEYLPVQSWESVHGNFLAPLEVAVSDESALLEFYSSLIRQWGIKLRTHAPNSGEFKPLSRVVVHAEVLAASLLEKQTIASAEESDATEDKPGTLSVIEFYCSLAELFSHAASHGTIRLTIPLSPTVYTLAFTPINSVISILCSVLATYKSAFETSLTSDVLQAPSPSDSLYPMTLVGQFNGYVMDICNLVWRNRALNTEDPNALGCLIPASTAKAVSEYIRDLNDISRERRRESAIQYMLPSIFSLSYHAALCNLSAAFFADVEEENNITEDQARLTRPVTHKALVSLEKEGGVKMSWQEYRVRMLDWLDATGSRGTGDLMRSTMKALRKD